MLLKADQQLGHRSVDILREAYLAKIPSLLLYGCELMRDTAMPRLEIIEMNIWKNWLAIPKGSVNAALLLELGISNIKHKHWQRVLN